MPARRGSSSGAGRTRWSGPIVRRDGDEKYYGAVTIDGDLYRIGDRVVLRNDAAASAAAKARKRKGKGKGRAKARVKVRVSLE